MSVQLKELIDKIIKYMNFSEKEKLNISKEFHKMMIEKFDSKRQIDEIIQLVKNV